MSSSSSSSTVERSVPDDTNRRIRQHCLRCHKTYDTARNPATCRIRHWVGNYLEDSWVIRKRDKWGRKISLKHGMRLVCCGQEKVYSDCEPDKTKMGWCIFTTHTIDPIAAYGNNHPSVITCEKNGCVHASSTLRASVGQKRKRVD